MLADLRIGKQEILVLRRTHNVMSDTLPHDVDRPENDSRPGVSALTWLCGGLGLYLGVFVLLVLDNFVFRTYFVLKWFPILEQPARILYRPMLWIAIRLGFLAVP